MQENPYTRRSDVREQTRTHAQTQIQTQTQTQAQTEEGHVGQEHPPTGAGTSWWLCATQHKETIWARITPQLAREPAGGSAQPNIKKPYGPGSPPN